MPGQKNARGATGTGKGKGKGKALNRYLAEARVRGLAMVVAYCDMVAGRGGRSRGVEAGLSPVPPACFTLVLLVEPSARKYSYGPES